MKKAIVIFIVIFLTIAVTFGIILYSYLDRFSSKGGQDSGSLIQPKEVKAGESFNILLLGVDIGIAGSKDSPKRSDTMLVLHYDPDTSEMSMVSIPRDTKVTIRGGMEKINAANAYGGPELAIKTVEDLLGISINYYVELNYEGFRKIVDAAGGIDTVIPFDMNYDDNVQNLHIHFKKGQKVHLDGKKAEEFVRWRKNNDNTGYAEGDLGRIKTQQDFIVKVIEKLKSAPIGDIISTASILPDFITTNMEPGTILNMAKELYKINLDSIRKYTLQGEPKTVNGIWYFIYEPKDNRDVVALLGGKAPPEDRETYNKDISVQILNGSGVNGAAEKIKLELENKGYKIAALGNISGVNFSSSYIIDKTVKGNNAKQIASELDINKIQKDQDTLSKVDVIIILGRDRGAVSNE